jgi:hypothetical protein
MDYLNNAITDLSQELANLAARHIAEEGLSYLEAKRKAAKQAGNAAMPSNDVIEAALREYLSLFMADTQPQELRRLRRLALNWLRQLSQLPLNDSPSQVFSDNTDSGSSSSNSNNLQALAVGAVVNGTANEHSPVHIHVFTDEFKALEIALLNANIALEHTDKKVDGALYPVLVAQDSSVPIALTVLPFALYTQHLAKPASSTNSHPQTANAAQLQALLIAANPHQTVQGAQ